MLGVGQWDGRRLNDVADAESGEVAALDRLSEDGTDDVVALHAEVIQWYAMGKSTEQIVRASGLDADTVVFWKARFLEFGVRALFRQSPDMPIRRRS